MTPNIRKTESHMEYVKDVIVLENGLKIECNKCIIGVTIYLENFFTTHKIYENMNVVKHPNV